MEASSVTKFIDQEMFNLCALTVLKFSNVKGFTPKRVAKEVASEYGSDYCDEGLDLELELAADVLREALNILIPHADPSSAATQLQYCVKNFHIDGTKKQKNFFVGSEFSGEERAISNKVQDCLIEITSYHLLVESGKIPLAPTGWTVTD